jgi:formiminoglutamase
MSDAFDANLSENRRWLSIADLVGPYDAAPVALIGAPLSEGSLTPGRCDLAPSILRRTLKRLSVYDLESETDLRDLRVRDMGDLALVSIAPKEAFTPIRDAVRESAGRCALTILVGGNNAVTRPGVHGLDDTLKNVGLLTLDAHFDLRDTDLGLNNGNPIQALIDDGLPGMHISQIGLAPFANTRRAHEKAKRYGIAFHTLAECRTQGLLSLVAQELERLSKKCERIYVDFDIDAIDRSAMPAAPGARPGGISSPEFFAATRLILKNRKVVAVDLAEFDPSLDVGDIGALTAARWLGEVLAGFSARRS